MDEHVKIFAERLKALRIEKNLTLVALAELTGLGISTLSQYENGEREVKTVNLLKIMKFFDVTADYLLGASDLRKCK
jgi:transcriptional regulator with XRE-family HTH domain